MRFFRAGLSKLITIFLCLGVYVLNAQTTPNYQLLSTSDGLSQGMVFDILQSRDGFIWIATNDGLNRYDGSRFEVFSPDLFNSFSIRGSEITKLLEDHSGLIWVSTPSQLEVFDPKSRRFFHVMHQGKPVSSQKYAHFAQTPDGTIWLTDNLHIWKINLPDGLLEKAVKTGIANIEPPCKHIALQRADGSPTPLRATKVLYAQSKKLLLGTNQGLFRFDFTTEMVFPEYMMPDVDLRDIAENKAGDILMIGKLPTEQKIWIWISGNTIQRYKDTSSPSYPRTVFTLDDAGYLWTFREKSIQKWQIPAFFNQDKPELEIKTDAALLKDKYAFCTKFLFDQSGVVWIGTNGFGIVKVDEIVPKFKTCLSNISQRIVVEAPDGGFYSIESPQIKYRSKSFDQQMSNTDYHGNFHPFDNSSIGRLAVCFDKAGNGWSLSRADSMLYRMDAVTKSQVSFPWRGVGLLCDRNGALLSIEEVGLRKFDTSTKIHTVFAFDKPKKMVSDYSQYLYLDADGTVWIFGFGGLIKAIPYGPNYQFEYFVNNPEDRNSLSSNTVLSVADDPIEPQRYLWVGTKGGGLNRLDKKTNQFKQYTTAQELPDNVVYGILAENPSSGDKQGAAIWLSTNKGLCRFDVRAETTKNFTVADGLQDNEFNSSSYLKTSDGTLIFGGIKGLTVFHPDSLRFNENVPQTHIVGLEVNNQRFDIAGKSSITLFYNQNLLTFDFAALEFTNPAQNQYRYQLVGVDKDWVALGNKNSIQFANLAPGTYTFKVLGSNNDGKWSVQPDELKFTIRPPWWASWWAYLLYLALVTIGGWLFYRYQLQQRLEHQETLRLKELDDFKTRFFTNITHEFRTPLTVIMGMSEQVLSDGVTQSNPVTIAQPLTLIKRNGENLLRLINQILDLAKLESKSMKINYIQGDILTFLKYITESLHSLANAQNLILRVESDEAKIVMDYDPERFLQIIHNLLSNAIKFTPSGGKIVLRADIKDNWLHISVSDSGAGIPADELPFLFERFFQAKNQEHAKAGGTGIGLSLTAELVKAMRGEITVSSTIGMGSTFVVKLPMTNNSTFVEKPTSINIETWKDAMQKSPTRSSSAPQMETALPHILIIEDNPDVVEYLHACLQGKVDPMGRPYVLDFAYNGQAGIEKALENIPDLIVSDVMMPIKDGFEVVEALKNDALTSHIPIILLTAKADVQSRLAGLRRGADAYLSKPFHQEELLVTVENLLELRRKLQLKYQQYALNPTDPELQVTSDIEDSFLQKVREIIDANYSQDDFGLPQLCQKIGMSRSQLFRKMKALTDIAPSDLIRSHRLNKAKALLESGATNVTEAAWQVGFKDPSYFSKLYQEEFGVAPGTGRK